MNDNELTRVLLEKAKDSQLLGTKLSELQFYIQAINQLSFVSYYNYQKETEKTMLGGWQSPYRHFIDEENIKAKLTKLDKLRPDIATKLANEALSNKLNFKNENINQTNQLKADKGKHMNSEYLIHGTNSLKGALKIIRDDASYKYEKESISLFLSYACDVLKILEKDEETLYKIVESSTLSPDHYDEFSSYQNFIQKFLVADKAIMLSSGMDKKVINYLFKDMEKMQRILVSKEKLTVENLSNRIHELSYFACEESTSVIGHKETINRTLQVVGGAAIVVVNASSDLILSGAASSLSQAFGGYVLGKGLDGLNSKAQKA